MKKQNKTIPWMLIAFILISFVLGFTVGEEVGEYKFTLKVANMFKGSNFDIDIDINETEMVDRMFVYVNQSIQDGK